VQLLRSEPESAEGKQPQRPRHLRQSAVEELGQPEAVVVLPRRSVAEARAAMAPERRAQREAVQRRNAEAAQGQQRAATDRHHHQNGAEEREHRC
jgi:hypothetical protein